MVLINLTCTQHVIVRHRSARHSSVETGAVIHTWCSIV